MPIIIDVRDTDVDSAALDQAFDWHASSTPRFSTYKDDSEICRLNRGELALVDAHPDVRDVLARCEELRVETRRLLSIFALPAGRRDGRRRRQRQWTRRDW